MHLVVANDVTLFGQSSGGYASCTLSVSPKSEELDVASDHTKRTMWLRSQVSKLGPMNSSYAKVISERVMEH